MRTCYGSYDKCAPRKPSHRISRDHPERGFYRFSSSNDFACGLTVLLQSRRASNRFDRLLTASFVAVAVLVWLKLLCSTVIDFARAVRISGSPVAVETYVPQTDC